MRKSASPPVQATWRGLTTGCRSCGSAVLSFDLADGSVVRLYLSEETQATLLEVLRDQHRVNASCPGCCGQPGEVA